MSRFRLACCLVGVLVLASTWTAQAWAMRPPEPRGRALDWRLATPFHLKGRLFQEAALRLAELVERQSNGEMRLRVSGAGELVPPKEIFEQVRQGRLEAGFGVPLSWRSQDPVVTLLSTGLGQGRPEDYLAWLSKGGASLKDEVYAGFGLKAFTLVLIGTRGDFFKRPVTNLSDLRGIRWGLSGPAARVASLLGATAVSLPPAELAAALQKGAIDAASHAGPPLDHGLGFSKEAKYYHYPSWTQAWLAADLFINLGVWQALPAGQRQVIEEACQDTLKWSLSEFNRRTPGSLKRLRSEGVKVLPWPEEIQAAARRTYAGLLRRGAEQNREFQRLLASLQAAARDEAFLTRPPGRADRTPTQGSQQPSRPSVQAPTQGDHREARVPTTPTPTQSPGLPARTQTPTQTRTQTQAQPQAQPPAAPAGNCAETFPNRHLFAVGVWDYTYLTKLDYVSSDLDRIRDLAQCHFGVPEKNMIFLRNQSRARLTKELRDFSRRLKRSDALVYFYYSGHGVTDLNGRLFLLPPDSSLDSQTDLEETGLELDKVLGLLGQAKGEKLVLIDACRVRPKWKPAVVATPAKTPAHMAVIYSAQDGQVSHADRSGRSSAFTKALSELVAAGLKNLDADSSGYVEIRELKAALDNQVKEAATGEQSPVFDGQEGIKVFPTQ